MIKVIGSWKKRPQRRSALLISKYVQPLLKGGGVQLYLLEGRIYIHILFGILLQGRCVSSPHLFIQLFISIWAHNLILCHLFCYSHYSGFGALSDWLLHAFTMPHPFLSISLLFVPQEASSSSCIFPALALDWAISPKSPDSFYWIMVFRNQNLGTEYEVVFLNYEMLNFSPP